METQKFYVCKIQANIGNIRETVKDILEYFSRVYGQMDESTYFELKVVLNELLINAVKHGCEENSDKYVKIVAGLANDEYALLAVEDDGDGYDTTLLEQCKKIGYPVIEEKAEQFNESGRGIFIVRHLCDDFMINQKGNKVVVNKKLIRA